jgi:hypothetical protein
MARRARNIATSVIGLILIGSIGFINLTQRPRFANFHTVDVLQLLGTGMCYGVALALIGTLRKRSAE